MYRHDPQRTGHSSSSAPDTNAILWTYDTDYEVTSSPSVANGRIIAGVSNGDILALDLKTGREIWRLPLESGQNSIWSSPAISSGRIYIGSRDNNLYCLNLDNGNLVWSFPTGDDVDSSPVAVGERVFFSSNDGYLYCLNAVDGTLIWRVLISLTRADEFSSPAVVDNVVFASSSTGRFYAVSASNGDILWTFEAGGSSAPVVSDGKVFFASGLDVYSLDAATGLSLWNATLNFPNFRSAPAISNNMLFVAAGFGRLYAFDVTTGLEVWSFDIGADVWSSPSVADGKVFIGSAAGNGRIYCFNETTGNQIWNHPTIERSVAGPVISDGIVIVGSGSFARGGIIAFGILPETPFEEVLIWIIAVLIVIVAAVVVAVLLYRRRRRKQPKLTDYLKK